MSKLTDMYENYKQKHNGEPKHPFGHFAYVMAKYDHHREIIRPSIQFWQEVREKNL